MAKWNITHGCSAHPLYDTWVNMVRRCTDIRNKSYDCYGAKGVTICDRWLESPANFIEDMGVKPDGYTIERIDNAKGYSKENCKWATRTEQNRNKSNTVWITSGGITMTATDWSRKLGGGDKLVSIRLHNGWSEQDAVTRKPRRRGIKSQ